MSMYGKAVAIEPEAAAERPNYVVFLAIERLLRHAQTLKEELAAKGETLDFATLSLHYSAPDENNADIVIGWKAFAA